MMVTKTFIEFKSPGSLGFNNISIEEVKDRSIEGLSIPDAAFAFSFFDVNITKDENGKELKSKRLSLSPTYFYGGRLHTFDEVRSSESLDWLTDPEELIQSIKNNNGIKAIQTTAGNWSAFRKNDILIPKKSNTSL